VLTPVLFCQTAGGAAVCLLRLLTSRGCSHGTATGLFHHNHQIIQGILTV